MKTRGQHSISNEVSKHRERKREMYKKKKTNNNKNKKKVELRELNSLSSMCVGPRSGRGVRLPMK